MAERDGRQAWFWLWASGAVYLGALLMSGCNAADADGNGGRSRNPAAGTGGGDETGGTGGRSGTGGLGGNIGNPMGIPQEYDSGVAGSDADIDDPDNQDCGGTAVTPMVTKEIIPGNILLVFDRSGSMDEPFPASGRKKFEEARDAVLNALTPLAANVNVGAIFFPHADACEGNGSCCVPAFGSAPQIDFMPGVDFLTAWNDFWANAPEVNGSTPTLEALQVAGQALTDVGGSLTGTTTVVLITDGEPRCSAGEPAGGIFGGGTTPELIAQWITLLTTLPAQWVTQGINTHVLGIPGADSAAGIQVLNGVALAGGTTQHISAADPLALQTEIEKIIGESVTTSFNSCSIGLPTEPPDLDKVVLVVNKDGTEQSVARDLGMGGGWALTGEGDAMEIILQGELCNQARMGTYSEISVVFGCVDLPPLPPPMPD
jgi:hypothetical protein